MNLFEALFSKFETELRVFAPGKFLESFKFNSGCYLVSTLLTLTITLGSQGFMFEVVCECGFIKVLVSLFLFLLRSMMTIFLPFQHDTLCDLKLFLALFPSAFHFCQFAS